MQRRSIHNPSARAEARRLVAQHEGHAGKLVEARLRERLAEGDVDGALALDQVRREIERVAGASA